MSALTTSLIFAACAFAGGVAGLHLHRVLPDTHLSKDTQGVVRLGTGMLSVLASLVLGLMIGTAKSSYDATNNDVRAYCAELTLLAETLRDYGDTALAPRRLVRDYTALMLHDNWPESGGRPFVVEDRVAGEHMEHVRESIRALTPVDAGQRWLQDQALQISSELLRERWLLLERAGPSVQPSTIAILGAWVTAIFVSFGMNAPRNATVVVAFLVCALAIGSAIFVILELDSPLDGMLQISSQPAQIALAHMLPATR